MAAETWLSAEEVAGLGLADRVEKPVRMAAHFDLSGFRNTPPQLAAMSASTSHQEDDMADPKNKRPGRNAPTAQVESNESQPAAEAETATRTEEDQGEGSAAQTADAGQPSTPDATPQRTPTAPAEEPASQPATPGDAGSERAPQPVAQVIDLDAVRTEERNATLAYVAEVHELCAIAGRGDLAAGFVAKATPVAQIRKALLEAGAAEDEASAIRSQVRPASTEPREPAIDTQAIYAARNQHCRSGEIIMAELTEGRYAGEFIVSEGNGAISRETITVLMGETLEAGAVLGKVTASGKYKALDPAAVDGSEAAAGILYDAVDATAADAEGVAIVRLAEVNAAEIVWPDGITAGEKTTALSELAALNIIAR